MREIKFRVWIPEKEMMVYIDNKFHITDGQSIYKLDACSEETRFFPMPFLNVEIMQSTGYQDKDGEEIYKFDYVEDAVGRKWLVDYSEKYASYILRYLRNMDQTIYFHDLNGLQRPLKRIGNKFESKGGER